MLKESLSYTWLTKYAEHTYFVMGLHLTLLKYYKY